MQTMATEAALGSGERARLLLVRPSPVNKAVFQITFKGTREIVSAKDSGEAMRVAAELPPDIIIIDMPDETDSTLSHSLLRFFRSNRDTKSTPIVLLAAPAQESEAVKGLALGAVDFITKPLSPLVLSARIQRHLDLKRERDSLQHYIGIDQVSGVASLVHFDAHGEREWRRAMRIKGSLSVAVIDIDAFRVFNETYGYEAGDNALRHMAIALASEMKRPSDLLARYHGDQFVALLPDTNREGAVNVVERLKSRVDHLKLPYAENSDGYMTVTIGMASVKPERREGLPEFLHMAGKALVTAKMAGRNRYHILTEDT